MDIGGTDKKTLFELAADHGVSTILWRKFGSDPESPEGVQTFYRLGLAMLLESLHEEISTALNNKGINACVVKGPVFAERLYDYENDRPFTDIDLILDTKSMKEAIKVMESIGYVLYDKMQDKSDFHMEYKFHHKKHPKVLIELHGNMVHYTLLRQHATFGINELLEAGSGDGKAPTALLATAIVHATLGHKIDKLQILVDVLQAVRKLPPDSYEDVAATLTRLRLGLECVVCLSVVEKLFEDKAVAELASHFRCGIRGHLGRCLVSPRSVIYAQSRKKQWGSWLRRKTFRLLQYIP